MLRRTTYLVISSLALGCVGACQPLEAQVAPSLPPSSTERAMQPALPALPAPGAASGREAAHQPDAAEVQSYRSRRLSESEQSELIRELQALLKGHNCYAGEINGLREGTREAIAKVRRHLTMTQAVDLAEMTIGDAVDLLDWLDKEPRPICAPDPAIEERRKEQERIEKEGVQRQYHGEARRAREHERQRDEAREALRQEAARQRAQQEKARQQEEARQRQRQEAAQQERTRQREAAASAQRSRDPTAERGEGGVSFDRSYARSGGAGSGGAGASGGGVSVRVPSF